MKFAYTSQFSESETEKEEEKSLFPGMEIGNQNAVPTRKLLGSFAKV